MPVFRLREASPYQKRAAAEYEWVIDLINRLLASVPILC